MDFSVASTRLLLGKIATCQPIPTLRIQLFVLIERRPRVFAGDGDLLLHPLVDGQGVAGNIDDRVYHRDRDACLRRVGRRRSAAAGVGGGWRGRRVRGIGVKSCVNLVVLKGT